MKWCPVESDTENPASTKCSGWKRSMLKTKTFLKQQTLKRAAQLDESFSKYYFEKTNFELEVQEILTMKLPLDSNSGKKQNFDFLQTFKCNPTLTFIHSFCSSTPEY